MRKISLLAGAIIAAFGSAATAASTTHNVNVNANVTGNCRFNDAGPTTLLIQNDGSGNIDPSSTTDATGTATVPYRCTKGTVASVSAGNGNNHDGTNRRVTDGTEFMAYSLNLSGDTQTGTGHGVGQDLTLTLDSTITAAAFQNVSAGAYADTVVLTITP